MTYADPNWTLPYVDDDPGVRHYIKIAVVILALLNVADIGTTYWAIHLGAHEGNPIAKLLLDSYAIVALKFGVCAYGIWVAWGRHRSPMKTRLIAEAWCVVGIYALAIYSNSMHIVALLNK